MKFTILVSSLVVVLITGCAEHSLAVLPEVQPIQINTTPIMCKLNYDGNREYLPSSLLEDNESSLSIHYSYKVQYVNGNTEWDGLNLFNPLIFVGFKLSEESVLVEGKLEIVDGLNKGKIFTSSCIATKARSLYQTGGSSVPRKSCLLAVRDNINTQLVNFTQGIQK